MRKTLVGALSAAALLLSSAPATAASTTRVDGSHFGASGVRIASQGCLDGTDATTPKLHIAKGPRKPPLGSRSVGWTPTGSGHGVGPTVHVDSPSTLAQAQIWVFSRESQASGQVLVNYSAPGDTGIWRGRSGLGADSSTGWHAVTVTSATYQWRHFTSDGVADQDAANASVADFVNSHGGDGGGAWVGFAYGCDGNAFFVDGLSVETSDGTKTYDFEGYGTRTYLTTGGERRTSVTITYGQKVGFTAHLRSKVGNDPRPGVLRIDAKPSSAKKWSKYATRKLGKGGNERVLIHPTRGTAYRASYAGSTAWERSTSHALMVRVRSKLNASIVDRTVTKGHPFVTTGRVLPGRSAKVRLQHFVHKKWTTVKSATSRKDGRFRISAPAKPVGTSYWRIEVAPGRGNLGAHTRGMKLTVKAPPSSGGGGGTPPPPSDPPPPPPSDPPPPPPPTH